MLNITKLYYEPKALDHQRGAEIFEKYDNATKIPVDSHWNINDVHKNESNLEEWNRIKSSVLILGIKKSIASRPNGRSSDWIAPSHSSGCAMSCSYCYVARRKGYANPITVFANIEQIRRHIVNKCTRLGNKVITPENAQTDPHKWVWDIGENNDCSVDALVSNNIKDLIETFANISNAKASFATKYVNRGLLDYKHGGNTRVRFSLMPEKVAKVVDVRTSPIAERIAAINDFVGAGYEVHINLSPVIIYEGWVDDYRNLFEQLDNSLNDQSKRQLKAEIIFLTHNENLHALNMSWHPKAEEKYLWRHWESKEDKQHNKFGHTVIQQRKLSQNGMVNLRYKNNVKATAIAEFTALLNSQLPYCEIRYCF